MAQTVRLHNRCNSCSNQEYLQGPSGGGSITYVCTKCHQEYILTAGPDLIPTGRVNDWIFAASIPTTASIPTGLYGKEITAILEDLQNRACKMGFPKASLKDMSDFTDYIRSLYPEYYSTEKEEPKYNLPEAYIPGLGTVRTCIDCKCLVAGGPTRCDRCAKEPY
jgi:hypothetical protein